MASSRRRRSTAVIPWSVVVPFAVSGVVHLVRPSVFTAIIPRPLRRWKRALVIASGLAEIACAAALLAPSTRRAAGAASAAVLLAVWPANMQMSIDLGRRARRRGGLRPWLAFAVSVVRLPVQIPLIRQALRAR